MDAGDEKDVFFLGMGVKIFEEIRAKMILLFHKEDQFKTV